MQTCFSGQPSQPIVATVIACLCGSSLLLTASCHERSRLFLNAAQVLLEQGLGKYADPEFVRNTSREMREALDMTREEMDRAAHQLLQQERRGRPLTYQLQAEYQPTPDARHQSQQQPRYSQLQPPS